MLVLHVLRLLANHFDSAVGWAFMMAVSCTKAMLVILFFMHVKYEANWKYVLTIPAGMMSIFLVLVLVPDVGLRNQKPSAAATWPRSGCEHMAEPEDVKAIVDARASIERTAECG